MKTSPRTAAKLCWLMTVISFVIAGIGLYTTIVELIYVGLGMVVVFMIILPIFVCRCPNCGQKLPTRGMLYIKQCPYWGKKFE